MSLTLLHFHRDSLVALHPVATQSLSTANATDAPAASAPRLRLHTILLVALLAILWLILSRHLSNEWSVNEQYNYGWFVPFFALYLFWLRWEDRPRSLPEVRNQNSEVSVGFSNTDFGHPTSDLRPLTTRFRPLGPFLLSTFYLLPFFLLLPIRLFEIGNPDWRPLGWVHAAIVAIITLILIWRRGGFPWVRHFIFPIAFFFVAVPWVSPLEQPIVQGLMRLVAAVATEAVTLFGIPAQLEGSLIRVNSGLVGVNEACSGVRSLQTSLMIGLLFGELKRFSVTRRFILLAAGLIAALLANFARAFFLVWIAATQSTLAVDRWHDFAGYFIVGAVFAVCLGVTTILSRRRSPIVVRKSLLPSDAIVRRESCVPLPCLIATLAWIVLIEVVVERWYRGGEQNMLPRVHWTVRWPDSAAGFRELRIDENVRSTLRFDEGREVVWRAKFGDGETEAASSTKENLRDHQSSCSLFFFRWEPGTATILRARAHRPDICLPNTGWRQSDDDGVRDYPVAEKLSLPFRHFSFVRDSVPNQRAVFAHAFFCLREDFVRATESATAQFDPGSKTPTDWGVYDRLKVVREGLRNPGQQVLEFVVAGPEQITSATAEKAFATLVPNLVQLIPNERMDSYTR